MLECSPPQATRRWGTQFETPALDELVPDFYSNPQIIEHETLTINFIVARDITFRNTLKSFHFATLKVKNTVDLHIANHHIENLQQAASFDELLEECMCICSICRRHIQSLGLDNSTCEFMFHAYENNFNMVSHRAFYTIVDAVGLFAEFDESKDRQEYNSIQKMPEKLSSKTPLQFVSMQTQHQISESLGNLEKRQRERQEHGDIEFTAQRCAGLCWGTV